MGRELEGHLHVLVSIEWSFEIHVFDVFATKFGSWGTDDTVPHNFCRDHVGCTCSELVRIIDEVAANGDVHLIRVILLGAVVDDDSCVCDCTIFWDAPPDFIMCQIENCTGANRDTFFPLGKVMQFLGHSRKPQAFQSWVTHELCVLGDYFFSDGMDDTVEDLFNVDVMLKPV